MFQRVSLYCVKSGPICADASRSSRYGFALKHKHLAEMARWTGLNEDTLHVEPLVFVYVHIC